MAVPAVGGDRYSRRDARVSRGRRIRVPLALITDTGEIFVCQFNRGLEPREPQSERRTYKLKPMLSVLPRSSVDGT